MTDIDVNNLLAQHRQEVALSDAIVQLKLTAPFKLIFENNLFTQQVHLLVLKLATLSKPSPEYDEVVRELDAISYAQNYLQQLTVKGTEAAQSIREANVFLSNNDED
jgi:hypothetical protein